MYGRVYSENDVVLHTFTILHTSCLFRFSCASVYGVFMNLCHLSSTLIILSMEKYLSFIRLGSAYSHAAALLFKIQTCSQMELNRVACTSKVCARRQSLKHAEAAPLKQINFKRPKKGSFPVKAPHCGEYKATCSSKDPEVLGNQAMLTKLKELRSIAPKCYYLF